MAIVHIAIFDAINAIEGGYRSYTGIPRVHDNTSVDSAIAQAAHDTLVAMYPSQRAAFDQELAEDLSDIPGSQAKTRGIALGRRAAAAILAQRSNDGSAHAEPVLVQNGGDWVTSNRPGRWRQDPISLIPLALGGHWEDVDPFVMRRANQFRIPASTIVDQSGIYNRLSRGEASRRRRHCDAHRTHRRSDPSSVFSGRMTERRAYARRPDCTTR